MAARRAALRLLDAVLRRGQPLETAFAGVTSGIKLAEDRGLVHALAGAVLRHLPDLDALIDGATKQKLPDDAKARMALRIAVAQLLILKTPPHAAIATVLPLIDGGPRRLVHGVFGTLARSGAALPDPPRLPPGVETRWQAAWGDDIVEAARIAAAAPAPLDLSVADPARTAHWAESLGGESLAPGHVRLPAGTAVAGLPGYDEGAWWVQDIAASLPARLLGPGDGRHVIDLCAAPGGKTMQLASAGWRVTAVDQSESRLARLRENLARTRLTADIVTADARRYAPERPVDAVLIDAPCSATGIFRRHPDVLHRATTRLIGEAAERQAAILAHAAGMLRPGGLLVYAVCSLEPEEGEAIADAFAAARPDFAALDGDFALPPGIAMRGGRIRVTPGTLAEKGGADGFFIAGFQRRD